MKFYPNVSVILHIFCKNSTFTEKSMQFIRPKTFVILIRSDARGTLKNYWETIFRPNYNIHLELSILRNVNEAYKDKYLFNYKLTLLS